MATTTVDLGDAHGNIRKFKYTLDEDGETLIAMAVTTGSDGGASLEEPIEVQESGGALTALQALAACISAGALKLAFPAAVPFCDASATASVTSPGGAALASHAFNYEFSIRNTHASQLLYLLADASGTASQYIRVINALSTERFGGAGNTNQYRLLGSGPSTNYILSGY